MSAAAIDTKDKTRSRVAIGMALTYEEEKRVLFNSRRELLRKIQTPAVIPGTISARSKKSRGRWLPPAAVSHMSQL
jgi:hypothetical protein